MKRGAARTNENNTRRHTVHATDLHRSVVVGDDVRGRCLSHSDVGARTNVVGVSRRRALDIGGVRAGSLCRITPRERYPDRRAHRCDPTYHGVRANASSTRRPTTLRRPRRRRRRRRRRPASKENRASRASIAALASPVARAFESAEMFVAKSRANGVDIAARSSQADELFAVPRIMSTSRHR